MAETGGGMTGAKHNGVTVSVQKWSDHKKPVLAAQKEYHENYHTIRRVAELKNLDWTDLTPEERNRLSNVRNVPDVVIQALQARWKELHNAVVNLEAEMDQINDFVEGFWRNLEGGGEG